MTAQFEASGGVALKAAEQAKQLGAPCPDQSEQAKNFTFVRLETDRLTQTWAEQAIDLQRDGAAWTINEGAPGERVPLRCLGGALDVTAVYEG